ncbi:hypothetical protein DFH09DRAFT_1372019 [Mycena vulgaris]|nr:hypothetical protein DFH09DRAFT_1372019 [Mycena vulgaris]
MRGSAAAPELYQSTARTWSLHSPVWTSRGATAAARVSPSPTITPSPPVHGYNLPPPPSAGVLLAVVQQEHVEEELPDADTSLFDSGFLNSFGASASTSASPASDTVSPFDAAQQMLHASQPVHAVSPHGVEFAEQRQQAYEQEQRSTPATARTPLTGGPQCPVQVHEEYPSFGFASERTTSPWPPGCTPPSTWPPSPSYDREISAYDSYASEFV